MIKTVKNYIKEESAIDDGVMKIIFVVLAIVVVMAIGWFAWNQIGKKAKQANTQIDGTSNPGAGNEFKGNPFGN